MPQELSLAFRKLVGRPLFSVIIIVTLAFGIGANTAIYSVVKGVLYETAPFEEVERLVWIGEHSVQVPTMSVAYPNYLDWRERTRSFESLAAHRYDSFNLTGLEQPEQIWVVYASASLFEQVLRVKPTLGRTFSEQEDQPGRGAVVVVSHSFWQTRLGGREDAVGRTFLLDGDPYEVIGVMPPGFVYPLYTDRVQMWLPIGHIADETWMTARGNHPGIYVTGRMAEGVGFEQAESEMLGLATALAEEYPDTNTGNSVAMQPLREFVVANLRPAVLTIAGAVALVLLLACVNVANLLLVRGSGRVQEMAVRNALGAGHWRIARQLLTESLLLAAAGGLVGVGVAYGSLKMLTAVVDPTALPVTGTIDLDLEALGFTLALSVATGLLFGIVPAIQAVRHDLVSGLKDGSKGSEGPGRQRVERALVVAQVAIALVLLAGALLFLRSFSNLVNADPGFDPEGVVAFDVNLPEASFPDDASRWAFYELFLAEIRSRPGVRSAAITLPLLGGWQSSFAIEGRPAAEPGQAPSADITRVSAGYFETLGVEVEQGRAIDGRDTAEGQPVAVIDRTMAELHFPAEDPIGQRLVLGREPDDDSPWMTIVGVVEHVKNYGVAEDSRVELYIPMAQRPFGGGTVVVQTPLDSPEQVMAGVESDLHELSADVPIANVRTLEQVVGRTMVAERFLAGMLSVFAAVAVLLAALGIYGVMAFFVAQRQREIGIRMALGAVRIRVVGLVAFQGLRLTLAGVVLGFLVVLLAGPHLGAQLFQVEPHDPATLFALPLLLLLVSLFACTSPVRRASRIEPVEALRYE